jgi:hypothetical protein
MAGLLLEFSGDPSPHTNPSRVNIQNEARPEARGQGNGTVNADAERLRGT